MKTSDVLKKLSDAYQNDALVTVVVLAKWRLVESPSEGTTWIKLGSALRRLACNEESVSALEKASSLIEKDMLYLVHYEMGLVYRDQGNYDIACQWFQKIIDCKPNNTLGYIVYGSSLARQGKLSDAEDLYRTALDCNEGDIDEVYCNIGLVQRAQGKLDQSKVSFENALALDPDYSFVKTQLADVTEAISLKELLNV